MKTNPRLSNLCGSICAALILATGTAKACSDRPSTGHEPDRIYNPISGNFESNPDYRQPTSSTSAKRSAK